MADNVEDHPAAGKPKISWGKRLSSIIAVIAAIAGIVTAVVALWPGPDVADIATITSAHVRVPALLSEFVARAEISPLHSRSAAWHPVAHGADAILLGLSGATQPTVTAQPIPTAQPTVTPQPTVTAQPTVTTQPTVTAQPTVTPQTSTPSISLVSPATEESTTPVSPSSVSPSGSSAAGTPSPGGSGISNAFGIPPIFKIPVKKLNELYEFMCEQPDMSGYDCPPPLHVEVVSPHAEVFSLIPYSALEADVSDTQGKPLPAEVAAATLAAKLNAGRSVPSHGKRDPVGALVTINMNLEGLRGQPLLLLWRLFPVSGASPLPANWWKTTVAYRLTPGTDHDSVSLDMWVPLPKGKGPYTLNLLVALESNGAQLTSYDTAAFR